jgi:hypothetical protein
VRLLTLDTMASDQIELTWRPLALHLRNDARSADPGG